MRSPSHRIIAFALLLPFGICVAEPPASPAGLETSKASVQASDIPEPMQKALLKGPLTHTYEIAFQLNPFYLRGDFNGDGQIDVAVLVKQRSSGKTGIAIIHGATRNITVIGAGTLLGNGGDDFEWMDTWQVRSKSAVVAATKGAKVHGDALFVGKSEAASALIYWNGKRYVWLQQGD